MAGRGCTIIIKVLGSAAGNGETEDISLPVALHSPLSVLKDELEAIVTIRPQDQILILCDLTDPDRNSDILLAGRDDFTLHECGIRNGSVLTMHALGMSAEIRQMMAKQALSTVQEYVVQKNVYDLYSEVGADDADHSYNGIIFDVECKGPYEINVLSVSVAGMLGRVRVYARDRGWEEDKPTGRSSVHWWAHRESMSPVGWQLVADQRCRPSWDKPIEIKLNSPLRILPHGKRAIYCHSGLPDDLGIQYQSYRREDVVGEDEYLRLLPGLGHTGSEPFDDQHGWYRSYRGLAGSIKYSAVWKGWNCLEHRIFPKDLRLAVLTMLLCQHSRPQQPHGQQAAMMRRCSIRSLPAHVILNILEYMHFDWFLELAQQNETYNLTPGSIQQLQAASRAVSQGAQGMGHNALFQLLQYFNGTAPMTTGIVDDDDEDDEDDDDYEDEEEYDVDDEEVEEEDGDMEGEEEAGIVFDDHYRSTAADAYAAMDEEYADMEDDEYAEYVDSMEGHDAIDDGEDGGYDLDGGDGFDG